MSHFYLFPQLPRELRIHIWSFTAQYRRVEIRVEKDTSRPILGNYFVASPTVPPAVMHASQESRRYAPYQRAFRNALSHDSRERQQRRPQYLWIDFATDRICFDDDAFLDDGEYLAHVRGSHGPAIERLGFSLRTLGGRSCFDGRGVDSLKELFPALQSTWVWLLMLPTIGDEEEENILDGVRPEDSHVWGTYPGDKVWFVEQQSGLVLSRDQLQMMQCWIRWQSWDGTGKAPRQYDDPWEWSLSEISEML